MREGNGWKDHLFLHGGDTRRCLQGEMMRGVEIRPQDPARTPEGDRGGLCMGSGEGSAPRRHISLQKREEGGAGKGVSHS